MLSASIGAAVAWTTQFKQRSRALPRNPVPDHVKVYDAIAAGDVEAAGEAMRLLVDLALEDTRSAMEDRRPAPAKGAGHPRRRVREWGSAAFRHTFLPWKGGGRPKA
ncbi:hypothetical protein GCM10020258_11930 [Sphingomonas yabuuchiae]